MRQRRRSRIGNGKSGDDLPPFHSATVIILPVALDFERFRYFWERLARQEHLRANRDNVVILPVVRIER